PERIEHDLEHLNITPEAARELFGAVLDADDHVDVAATEENRKQIMAARVQRLGNGHGARDIHSGEASLPAGDNLAVYGSGDAARWACARCAADLGPLSDNYKDLCLREDLPVSDSNPLVGDPADFVDDTVSFRLFHCPSCGGHIDNEIAVDSDPVMRDIELTL
ncbi:MAG: hypothetical protein HOJ07_04980, partial [Rhodospirillaceae bacterium]|nr:hypothetical protein [Rhodospirillaceae bacterium]